MVLTGAGKLFWSYDAAEAGDIMGKSKQEIRNSKKAGKETVSGKASAAGSSAFYQLQYRSH
ncbi:MAG: hypothetical protein DWH91_14880 [Planctomycetota bacterium]|nr:MAG: hypothetical protein DWH91_14880 [Planctomycetota bacterium]